MRVILTPFIPLRTKVAVLSKNPAILLLHYFFLEFGNFGTTRPVGHGAILLGITEPAFGRCLEFPSFLLSVIIGVGRA